MKLPRFSRSLLSVTAFAAGLIVVGLCAKPLISSATSTLGGLRNGTTAETDRVTQIRQQIADKLKKPHQADTFIVRYKEHTSIAAIASVQEKVQPQKGKLARLSKVAKVRNKTAQKDLNATKQRTQFVKVESGKLAQAMELYALDPAVEAVYPSYRYKVAWTSDSTKAYPDDFDQTPSVSTGDHWNLERINAPMLWRDQNCQSGGGSCGGSSSVIVAVIDTGVAFENYSASFEYDGSCGDDTCDLTFEEAPNLSSMNLWTNSGEDTNGGDEDGNGVCDDLHGADMAQGFENYFSDDQNPDFATACASSTDIRKEGHPNDDVGHGTFVTSIIAANTNDGARSVGLASNVTIMPIKANDGPFSEYFFSVVLFDSIVYAVDEGASVINLSIEIDPTDDYLQEAVAYAEANGVAVILAAGNSNRSISFPEPMNTQAIVVGSTDSNNNRSSYSNYGPAIDIVAPVGSTPVVNSGAFQQTYTCYATGGCGTSSNFTAAGMSMMYSVGTSFSAPQVTAAAALIKSRFPSATAADIRFLLTRQVTDIGAAGKDSTFGYGLLNLAGIWNGHFFGTGGQVLAQIGNYADRYYEGDFNGDDRVDVLRIYNKSSTEQRAYVALNDGNTNVYQPSSLWHSGVGRFTDRFLVADFNGDGRDDLLRIYNKSSTQQWGYVALSSGSSFGGMTRWSTNLGLSKDRFLAGYFDNNSRADVLRIYNKSTDEQRGYVATSTGSAFNPLASWTQNIGKQKDTFLVGDIDGDNDSDLIRVYNKSSTEQRVYVAPSLGTTFSVNSLWLSSAGLSTDRFYAGDFNGDGKADFMRVYNKASNTQIAYVAASSGIGYGGLQRWRDNIGNSSDRFLIGDFNNDDDADIVRLYNASSTNQRLYHYPAL